MAYRIGEDLTEAQRAQVTEQIEGLADWAHEFDPSLNREEALELGAKKFNGDAETGEFWRVGHYGDLYQIRNTAPDFNQRIELWELSAVFFF